MPSIRLHLLKWLIGPILLINLAGGVLTYMLAWLPAQIAFDQSLSDATGALGARLATQDGAWRIDLPPQAEQVLRNDDTDAVYFIVRDGAGRALAGDAEFPALRNPARPATPLAYDGEVRGEAVRIATLRIDGAAGPAYVHAQRPERARRRPAGAHRACRRAVRAGARGASLQWLAGAGQRGRAGAAGFPGQCGAPAAHAAGRPANPA
jgi:two-component system sensor histidine kinase TctE